jgi:very-short-patch-repair endonuclease
MARSQYRSYKGITQLARNLRKNPTSSEKSLWQILRRKNICGYRFLRQHPVFYRDDNGWIEFFIADFYCSELKLIIELDGPIHNNRHEYDSERDSKLLSKGIHVLRIKNEELIDTGSVINRIEEELTQRALQVTDL